MDAGYISALAGSAIGGLASFATTWVTYHSQIGAVQLVRNRARREAHEASRLFGDAFGHGPDDPVKMVELYAIVSKIRLFGDGRTLDEAEEMMRVIDATYVAPVKELCQFADTTREADLDTLYAFSNACRAELKLIRR